MSKNKHDVEIRKIEKRYNIGEAVIKWLGIIAVAFIVKDNIRGLVDLSKWWALIVAMLVIGLFIVTKLLYKKTAYFSEHIKKLESKIDKNRTSSGLTKEGQTHPNDK